MIFVDAIFVLFCGSLLFQPASSLANASKQVVSNKTPDVSPSTKCHNVHFNNYYSGPPNKDIKAHLLKIENQLADIQNAMTGNKTLSPGKCPLRRIKFSHYLGNSSRFLLAECHVFIEKVMLLLQLRKTVLSCINQAKESTVFIQSTPMIQVPLMSSVTKPRPVGGG